MNLQLPSEVLDHIGGLLYESSCRQLDTLVAFSLVSRQFRKSALPFLFGTVSHVVRDRLDQRERGLLRRLLNHKHLLGYVHTLHVLRPLGTQEFVAPDVETAAKSLTHEHMSSDLQAIRESLPFMHRLRRIRYAIAVAGSRTRESACCGSQRCFIVGSELLTSF